MAQHQSPNNTSHKYFDSGSLVSGVNSTKQTHPILNNSFMRPQQVVRNNSNAVEIGSVNSLQNEATSSSSSSNSSFNPVHRQTNNTQVETSNSSLLDSKKAREAFYQSLKLIETKQQPKFVNQSNQKVNSSAKLNLINSSSSSISSRNQSIGPISSRSNSSDQFNTIRILNSNRSKQIENEVRHIPKPYDNRSNFSNLIKIDTRFKSDSFDNNVINVSRNQFLCLNQLRTDIKQSQASNLEEQQLLKENQQKLLQQSQDRLKNLQDLINRQKSKHRQTITNLLQRRQNIIQNTKPITHVNYNEQINSSESNSQDRKILKTVSTSENLLNQGKHFIFFT